MRVYELDRDNLIRLKQLYLIAVAEEPPTYGQLVEADNIVDDDEIMAVYGFVDIPEGFFIPEHDERFKHSIKVMLSCSPGDLGEIEGVWVLVDDRAKEAYDNDERGGFHDCVMDNASIRWRGLYPGAKMKMLTRGDKAPIVTFKWLETRYDLMPE